MSGKHEYSGQRGYVSAMLLAPLGWTTKLIKQTTSTRRRAGYETSMRRIQGFVLGALLVVAVDEIERLLHNRDLTALTTAWSTAILAAFVLAGIVALIDRNEKEPWHVLFVGFLWGAVVSTTLSQPLKVVVCEFFDIPSHVAAPFTEELAKGLFLFLVFWFVSDEFDNALDGIIYGAMVGLGFAMWENVGKFSEAPSASIAEQMRTLQFFVRIILGGLASHATYTAITGLALGLGRQTRWRWAKIALPPLGLVVAILAHALWNSDALDTLLCYHLVPLPIEFRRWQLTIRAVLLTGPFFLGVIGATIWSWRKESRVIAKQLTGELDPNDPYTSPAMMYTVGARRRARWQILRTRGILTWWILWQLQQSLIKLAFCKEWRSEEKDTLYALRQRIRRLRNQLESWGQ